MSGFAGFVLGFEVVVADCAGVSGADVLGWAAFSGGAADVMSLVSAIVAEHKAVNNMQVVINRFIIASLCITRDSEAYIGPGFIAIVPITQPQLTDAGLLPA